MLSWILSLHCMSSSPSQSLLSRIRKPHLLIAFCGLAVYQILAPFLPSLLLSNSSKQFFLKTNPLKSQAWQNNSFALSLVVVCVHRLSGGVKIICQVKELFFFSSGWKQTHMGLAWGDPVSPLCPLKLSSNSFHYHFWGRCWEKMWLLLTSKSGLIIVLICT